MPKVTSDAALVKTRFTPAIALLGILDWIPADWGIDTRVQALHVLLRQFKVKHLRILDDARIRH